MATTIDHERAAGRGGTLARRMAVAAGDRTGAFRAARRHSRIVRVLRVGLPLSALLMSVTYVISVMEAAGWGDNLPQLIVPRIMPENLAMRNPRYEGFNKDGGTYVVTAKAAAQVLTNFNLIKLETISGDFTDAQKSVTHLDATRGTFDSKANKLELFDGIEIKGDNGLRAKLSKATVMTKDGTVTSKEPVEVEMSAGTIRSNQMTYRNQSRELTFVDSVETHLKARAKPAAAAASETEAATKKLFGGSDAPVDIKSSRLDIDDANKTATFTGNVRAVQATATVTAPEMIVTYESAQPDGAAPKLDGGGSLKRIVAKGPVVIDQAPADHVTADQAEFDAVTEKAILTGNVVMVSGEDRRATGDAAEIDQRADTILLNGNVVVLQGRNELKGQWLFVDRKSNRTQLTSGDDGGRISARFYQNQTGGAKSARSSGSAETGALGLASFKADPNAPINIEANRLDVNDVAKTAVFSGDVRAEQGEITIQAAQLTAYYSGDAGAAKLGAGDAKSPAAQLSRIEARTKVVITSTKGQKATGDWANFDPKKNVATVGGDVVLTEGKNVVRGSRLDIDTVTGQSMIHASPDAVSASTAVRSGANAAASAVPQTPRKRPSAIFYPKKANGAAKSKGSASSWGATTATPPDGEN